MNQLLVWGITAFGMVALVGVFVRMKPGLGPFTLKAVGLVLVATFASLLALNGRESLTAAMGILGAIGGYLFGLKDSP